VAEFGAPFVDEQIDTGRFSLRRKQYVDDVPEGQRKGERQRKFSNTHEGRANHEA
jgi:hypothetical protein